MRSITTHHVSIEKVFDLLQFLNDCAHQTKKAIIWYYGFLAGPILATTLGVGYVALDSKGLCVLASIQAMLWALSSIPAFFFYYEDDPDKRSDIAYYFVNWIGATTTNSALFVFPGMLLWIIAAFLTLPIHL